MTNDLAIRILNGDVLGTTEQTNEAVAMAIKALSALPSADVQPARHGRWIKTRMPVTGAIEIKCSECGQKYYTAFPLVWRYCPECGATMDEKNEK